jgi:hypothetical protein
MSNKMVELQCQYTLLENKHDDEKSNESVLKFKKMLMDTFFSVVQNRDLSERDEFGKIFTSMINTLCKPTK